MRIFAALMLLVPLMGYAAEGEAAASSEGGGEASKKPLPPPQPNGPDNINTYLHLQVNNLTKAEPPRVVDRKVIFTWKGDTTPRYVAAAFAHESWRQKHLFWRNQNGVYFLVYDLTTESPTTLSYRLIVDGLWMTDPTNSMLVRNSQGIALSQTTITTSDLPAHHGPVQGYFGELEFVYHGKAGQQVSVVGNFNQWDPFAHFLEEEHPGEYHLKLNLAAGTVLYKFVIGTKSMLDPGNAHTGHDDQGGTFSYFENQYLKPSTILESKMAVASAEH